MKESFLQEKLIEKINNQSFLESIENVEMLDEALRIDYDENTIPAFSIDHLLKRKYSKSAKSVLKTLECYEIISGDKIKNISLDKKDRLFPDGLLFNYETNEIIVIENKTKKQTEREAITELLGYGMEIRNSLPFISDFDICFIIISTEFNTLLNHAISSQILSTESKLLCLKVIENNQQIDLEVHFPSSWTNIGQNDLPRSSFMSYTLTLKKRSSIDASFTNIIQLATDLINFDANQNKCSGFCIAWENGMNEYSEYGITIYVINPFVFLPNAVELGFDINENSVLSNYIFKRVEQNGVEQTPNSLFRIADRAKELLDKYFISTWERNTSWEQDLNDEYYQIQRFPVFVESFGIIGEFIRYYYYHPAVRKYFFTNEEMFNSSPNDPYLALQIINIITGNHLFKNGHFYATDIFNFGRQLRMYIYSCENALNATDEKIISIEALLFWTNISLVKSIKEISLRVHDTDGMHLEEIPLLKIYSRKGSVNIEYRKQLNEFVKWFKNDFLGKDSAHYDMFRIGFSYSHVFSDIYKETLSIEETETALNDINNSAIYYLSSIICNFKNDGQILNDNDKNILKHIIDCDIELCSLGSILEQIKGHDYEYSFSNKVLELIDSIYGEVYHKLKDIYVSDSIDFKFLKKTADERFNTGYKYSAVKISSNGHTGITEISQEHRVMGELSSTEEIYVIFYYASGHSITLKKPWSDVINGDFINCLNK